MSRKMCLLLRVFIIVCVCVYYCVQVLLSNGRKREQLRAANLRVQFEGRDGSGASASAADVRDCTRRTPGAGRSPAVKWARR